MKLEGQMTEEQIAHARSLAEKWEPVPEIEVSKLYFADLGLDQGKFAPWNSPEKMFKD